MKMFRHFKLHLGSTDLPGHVRFKSRVGTVENKNDRTETTTFIVNEIVKLWGVSFSGRWLLGFVVLGDRTETNETKTVSKLANVETQLSKIKSELRELFYIKYAVPRYRVADASNILSLIRRYDEDTEHLEDGLLLQNLWAEIDNKLGLAYYPTRLSVVQRPRQFMEMAVSILNRLNRVNQETANERS